MDDKCFCLATAFGRTLQIRMPLQLCYKLAQPRSALGPKQDVKELIVKAQGLKSTGSGMGCKLLLLSLRPEANFTSIQRSRFQLEFHFFAKAKDMGACPEGCKPLFNSGATAQRIAARC